MKVFFDLDEIDCSIEPTAVALGTFDGLHIGHVEVLNYTKKAAEEKRKSL